jgi:hypothetical protein
MYGLIRKSCVIGPMLLAGVLAIPMEASADKGRFQGHSVLLASKYNEFKAAEGHPYKAAQSGEMEGLLFYSAGGKALDKMLERSHYIVQWVGDAGTGSGYCMKTFTTSEGHKLFARCDWKGGTEKGSSGIVTLLGGTGPFNGIKGKGKFNVGAVSDRVFWDDIEWDWETP